jgi:D-xylose transport system substrate-binding protein
MRRAAVETVGLLLPENQIARYEQFDKPLIEKRISELTDGKDKIVGVYSANDGWRAASSPP